MEPFLTMGRGGIIDTRRIILVASARSTPIKRLLQTTRPEQVINLTYGYPRESVVVMEGGFLIISSLTVDQFSSILPSERVDPDEPTFKQRT
jgi:regulator of extracellular matrix RemA (YlzA/DUF370 family)